MGLDRAFHPAVRTLERTERLRPTARNKRRDIDRRGSGCDDVGNAMRPFTIDHVIARKATHRLLRVRQDPDDRCTLDLLSVGPHPDHNANADNQYNDHQLDQRKSPAFVSAHLHSRRYIPAVAPACGPSPLAATPGGNPESGGKPGDGCAARPRALLTSRATDPRPLRTDQARSPDSRERKAEPRTASHHRDLTSPLPRAFSRSPDSAQRCIRYRAA
jgi:hypothetical protein